jgi:hypothetical protein
MMSSIFQQLISLMFSCERHKRVLLGEAKHADHAKLSRELNLDIYVTPYIEPQILKNAETEAGRWKLRQPIFNDVNKTESDIIQAITEQFVHPYYKRVTAIDRDKGVVYKLYSIEHQRNYAIQQQGDKWGHMVMQLCESTPLVCNMIDWLPNLENNIHGAIFEYVDGETVDSMYCEIGRKLDTGHPDVVAGNLKPYWGTISCVNVNNYMFIKRKIINMYVDICRSSQHVNMSDWNYQQTDNEPDWTALWVTDDPRRILNVDDWRLQNIIETPSGDWIYIKPDRVVLTDPSNATKRFVADMRNQTNISIAFETTIKKYENTLV